MKITSFCPKCILPARAYANDGTFYYFRCPGCRRTWKEPMKWAYDRVEMGYDKRGMPHGMRR